MWKPNEPDPSFNVWDFPLCDLKLSVNVYLCIVQSNFGTHYGSRVKVYSAAKGGSRCIT